ncbi:MAG: tetratricopeptide repeat protein, partial [Nodularia sp. (in: cyanobacteria)]|nr:tetratricopeptide repeat protein [Nodularia sp. (in: cyanobacteria)]
GEGTTLHNLGFTYSLLANNRQAMKYYEQAIAIYQEIGDCLGEISTLLNMGNFYAKTKRKKLALSYYHNAQSLAKAIESQPHLQKVQQFMDAL